MTHRIEEIFLYFERFSLNFIVEMKVLDKKIILNFKIEESEREIEINLKTC